MLFFVLALHFSANAAAEQAKVTAPKTTEKQSSLSNSTHKFAGIKASSLIYFGYNENWTGSALMVGRLAYALSGDLTTATGAVPSGDARVVVFRNLNKADTLQARKVGGKPNAAYLLTSTGQLKYLGDIDKSLDNEAVFELCGNPRGATEKISWADFFQFLKPKQKVKGKKGAKEE